ncbi:hypothetical protein THAOC_07289, partial [Thalassiosira oceanica]
RQHARRGGERPRLPPLLPALLARPLRRGPVQPPLHGVPVPCPPEPQALQRAQAARPHRRQVVVARVVAEVDDPARQAGEVDAAVAHAERRRP